MDNTSTPAVDLLNLTADIVSAHVANNSVSVLGSKPNQPLENARLS